MCRLLVSLVLVAILAPSAWAQSGRRLSLGAAINFREFVDDRFDAKNPGFSVLYRLSMSPGEHRDGWKLEPSGSVGWSKTDAHSEIGGTNTDFGRMKSTTVMVGGGPSYRRGPTKVGISMVLGPSFNSFDVDEDARTAYNNQKQTLNAVEVEDVIAVKTGASLWHDLSSRLGLHGSVGYLYHRPNVKTNVDGTVTNERWRTDKVTMQAGFAVGIF
jgi:hypothetical protein